LEVRLIDDAAGSDEIRQILSEGRRAASLTRQLLALSRKELMVPVLLDLSSAIGDIEEMLRRTIGEDITLTINSAAQSGAIKADLGQIQQILINLTVNARDAMPHGGRLVIDTTNLDIEPGDAGAPGRMMKPGRYAVLSVCDTGVGMDAATRARVFEPFFTTKGLGKGTGLGLSTVYGIVKQSQGYIFVDSEVGNGTRFTLYFPIVPGVAVPIGARAAPERPIRGTETVLVIEDEEPLRAVLERTLTANGYTVFEARDGNAAIRFADNLAPVIHLLLTDVILPGMSGKSVADRLAVSRPAMKVIYMSGYTDDFIAHHGVLNPGIILLEKPFSVASLLLRVRETLDTVTR
jgi:CheY-like chemotaxis protein